MDDLTQRDGLWWPAADRWGHKVIPQEVGDAIDWLKAHNTRWGSIVQAGGNVGVYARVLSGMFDQVFTYEPDWTNWRCLIKNVTEDNVIRTRAALSDRDGLCRIIEHDPENCGAHMIGPGSSILEITLDGEQLAPDVIWLDIEGSELQALRGAERTITAHKPLIIVELKGLGKFYGYKDSDVTDLLEGHGYRLKSTHLNDQMWEAT